MRYRLVRRLAQVAHEGVILDADALEAVLGMRAAVGAGCVGGEAGELFYHLSGGCGRHRCFCFIVIVLCGCRCDMMGMGCEVAVVRKWNLPGRTISVQPVIVIAIALSVVVFAVLFWYGNGTIHCVVRWPRRY